MTETQNKNKNRRRFSQRKRGTLSVSSKTNSTTSKNNNLPKIRELKFYLHDSAQRKTSESFNKIREAIITKIQKTFEDSVDVVASLEAKAKMSMKNPMYRKLLLRALMRQKPERTGYQKRNGRFYSRGIRTSLRNLMHCGLRRMH